MPLEPQNKERPPPPAPEHRAQLIGDLLQRIHMPMDNEWKKRFYENLLKTLCDDSAREDNYRMEMIRLFSIGYRWIGGVGPQYVNITLNSEDIGYLKSHDMSMTFLETDASQNLMVLVVPDMPFLAAKETSDVPSPSAPSSTTSGIRIPDTAIVFSYEHPEVGAAGPESNSTESQGEIIKSRSIWLVAEFKIYRLRRNGLPYLPTTANSLSKVCLGQCLMYLDAAYQMFHLPRALAICGTKFLRVWALSDRHGHRTFAAETSRPLGNGGRMFAADFFNKVDLDLFPHNLIIPSPPTNSFAVNYQKCEFLERTFSSVCDNILLSTIESALQPHESTFDYRTEVDPTFPVSRVCDDVKEFACQARPKLKKRAAEETAQAKTFKRSDGSGGGGSNREKDSDIGKGPRSGGRNEVRRGDPDQSAQSSKPDGMNDNDGWEDGVGEKERSLDPLLKVVEKEDQKQYVAKWQSQLPSSVSSYDPLPPADDLDEDKEAVFIDYTNTIGRTTYYQVSLITRAVEMFNMEIIPVSTATMDKLYSGQITSQHVLANPGWDAAVNKRSFSRPLQTLAHANYPLPVPSPLFPRKPPSSSIKGSPKPPCRITKGR
ncbi:hypothetical protein D1P53_001508 [Cryptococcus gattii VGV]|nr:hypothetical protein D1P53_001508 [Cryptococcus gattii VGV]